MATYKGIALPDRVAPLARHMALLEDHREALARLDATWDTLALLSPLSGLEADAGAIRAEYDALATELLAGIAEASLARVSARLGHQAQLAIDLLVRTLRERAAGVGVLAADAAVVSACINSGPDAPAALQERLRLHAERYTVCRDAVLMAADGHVIARLHEGFRGRSASPVLAHALATPGGYVESDEPADFCGAGRRALVHAARVEHEGRPVGVLALEFDLAREARLLFDRLVADDEVLAFVDATGHVVLSSDPARLPSGHRLALRADAPVLRLPGVAHVAVQRIAPAWQGYAGPGWTAVALAPADGAFEAAPHAEAVPFSGETVFPPRLLAVPERAREIQRRLDRLAWNGRVQAAEDAKRIIDEAREATLQLRSSVEVEIEQSRVQVETLRGEFIQDLRDLYDRTRDTTSRVGHDLESEIKTNPVRASLIALGAGFILGALFANRR